MQRSILKNIIKKSKEFSVNSENSFDQFKKTFPIEVGSNYRLEAAWKAYGAPKDFKEAIWLGMVQPVEENKFKLPSIGYNTDTDEYEYLNTGKENETVAKDIRVWDNDVIPFVKELKYGGYIRKFNEEKNCWTYTKEVNSYKKGGKTKDYKEWVKDVDPEFINNDYDLEKAYKELPIEELDAWKYSKGKMHLSGKYKKETHPTYSDKDYGWIGSDKIGWTFYVSPRQQALRSFDWYKQYWDKNEPNSILNYNGQLYESPTTTQVLKQGGQMNLIPEGALHAHKNHMELAKEGEVTSKGIPVVDNGGNQQAEIERNEIILNLSTTEKIEHYYKQYIQEENEAKKDEIAIKCGQMLTKSIIEDTDDKTGLIEEIASKN